MPEYSRSSSMPSMAADAVATQSAGHQQPWYWLYVYDKKIHVSPRRKFQLPISVLGNNKNANRYIIMVP